MLLSDRILINRNFYSIYVYDFFFLQITYVCVCVCDFVHVCGTCGSQKGALDSLELAVTGSWEPPDVGMGIKFKSSARTVGSLNL